MEAVKTIDRSEVKTEWVKPQENPLDGLTQEDINKLLHYRTEVLTEVSTHYKALVEAILKQPFHVIYRQYAFMNIDQGMGWVKTAVDNLWDLPKVEDESQSEIAASLDNA